MSSAVAAPGRARRQLVAGSRETNKELSPAPTTTKREAAAAADKARGRLQQQPGKTAATRGVAASMLLRRQELLLLRRGVGVGAGAGGRAGPGARGPPSSSASLSVSCASEASTDSFCSRASTGRIGRPAAAGPPGAARRRAAGSAGPPSARPAASARMSATVVPVGATAAAAAIVVGSADGEVATSAGPARCPWITPNTDPCYAAFHDQEWGVPVHDDKKLFEMLVLSGALAEMTWPVILSKRDTFRDVFMDFDPLLVSKLNEKKFLGPSSPASSLLSEHRLRIIIENARELLKVIEEFGSFDDYCWGFLSYKPVVGRFRHTREVPLRTAKAEAISQDLMRRGFRGVGPTVVYAFMQAVGMANDHLVTCHRFDECCAAAAAASEHKAPAPAVVKEEKEKELSMLCGLVECVGLETAARAAAVVSIS